MEFFDSHAHYNDERFNNDREEILQNLLLKEKITKITCVGYNVEKSRFATEIANKNNFIFATVRNISK